jgi:L-threonylcarbamoyladenylate synthase
MKIVKLKNSSVKEVVKQATEVLRQGGLVIYPTETVYGVGVDATNQGAVEKLLAYKSRREGKPLSIAVTGRKMAEEYVELNDQALELYRQFLPGPYTIVSRGKGQVAAGVESEFGTLGVRIPDYPVAIELVKELGRPMTATSANASGKKRPYAVNDIFDHLSAKQKSLVELVIDAGELPKNEPSIVIDTTLSTPLTVRGGQKQADQLFITHSDQETRELAGKLLLKYWERVKTKGLVIGLNGELGVGKTVFTQGIGQFLQINEAIVSPTYIYLEEYDYVRHGARGKLYHLDMWKIDTRADFAQLQVGDLVKPGNVVAVEWWQETANWWPGEPDLLIDIEETGERVRSIAVKERQ